MIERRDLIPASVVPWTPGEQAGSDQLHAEAVGRLREADTYFLVTAKMVDGERCDMRVMAGGAAPEEIARMVVLNAATESVRMYEQVFMGEADE